MSRASSPIPRTAIVATALLFLLAPAAGAAAKPSGKVHRFTEIELEAPGTNGYQIDLYTVGEEEFILIAKSGPLSARYIGEEPSRGDSFDANLGKLGNISLRFHSSNGHESLPLAPKRCSRTGVVKEEGIFKGHLSFTGEQDYTKISANRIEGSLVRIAKRVCGSGHPHQPPPPPSRQLAEIPAAGPDSSVGLRAESGDVVFDALHFGDEEGWKAAATRFEHREGLEIIREANLEAPISSISFGNEGGEQPTSATVTPPAPFSGTATYTATPASGSPPWSGSLSVPLPGVGTVALAGSGFDTRTCRTSLGGDLIGCLFGYP